MKCRKCGAKIGIIQRENYSLCNSCKDKENRKKVERRNKNKKAVELIKKYFKSHGYDGYGKDYSDFIFVDSPDEDGSFYDLDKDEVIELVVKNNYEVEKVIGKLIEDKLVSYETKKIKEREQKRKIRELAEKELYGKIKTMRKTLTDEEKEMVFDKFDNECAVCGKKEGLHIHHKDENPSNNQMNNLVVLCGVCHKKTHMRIR